MIWPYYVSQGAAKIKALLIVFVQFFFFFPLATLIQERGRRLTENPPEGLSTKLESGNELIRPFGLQIISQERRKGKETFILKIHKGRGFI